MLLAGKMWAGGGVTVCLLPSAVWAMRDSGNASMQPCSKRGSTHKEAHTTRAHCTECPLETSHPRGRTSLSALSSSLVVP